RNCARDDRIWREGFSWSVSAHRVQALLGEIAVPVRVVTCEHRLVKRACLRELAGALRVARRPIARASAIVSVHVSVFGEMFGEHSRRLRKVLSLVRVPREIKLRL